MCTIDRHRFPRRRNRNRPRRFPCSIFPIRHVNYFDVIESVTGSSESAVFTIKFSDCEGTVLAGREVDVSVI